ncbi:MAG TPA: IS1595 family transposase [Nitrososphaera sp.]|nr:IS1595 family transposase [Nitrososphaera sp.]
MNLIDVTKTFSTEDQCLDFLEKMRWPTGVRCLACESTKLSLITRTVDSTKTRSEKKQNKRTRLYACLECGKRFTPTVGTIFHSSHLPLTKWFMALAIVMDAKKGMSANQLKQHLGIGSYRTAWYMVHRIRKAMVELSLGKLSGIVELDETYVGGKQKGKGVYYGKKQKQVVVGLRQRKGPLRFIHTKDAKANTLKAIIEEHIGEEVQYIMTDESSASWGALLNNPKHKVIRHNIGKYVEGIVHTNSIESAFSLLKRGIIGSFHRISIKHLHRYLAEFQYRFNARNDADRFERMVRRLLQTDTMQYKQLIADPVSAQ